MKEELKTFSITDKMFVDSELQCIFEEETTPYQQTLKKLVDLREANLRRSLISLGWTPPKTETKFGLQETPEERLSACVSFCEGTPSILLQGIRFIDIDRMFEKATNPKTATMELKKLLKKLDNESRCMKK